MIQDASQLILQYGERQANVILSMVGNIISGQVTGESAKALSERFGKIMQDPQSLTINDSDTSLDKCKQLDYAIPQSTIASLSAGEVVEIVADNSDQRIPQKLVHAQLQHNFAALKKEESGYKCLPQSQADKKASRQTYLRIKWEVKAIVAHEIDPIASTLGTQRFIAKKDDLAAGVE